MAITAAGRARSIASSTTTTTTPTTTTTTTTAAMRTTATRAKQSERGKERERERERKREADQNERKKERKNVIDIGQRFLWLYLSTVMAPTADRPFSDAHIIVHRSSSSFKKKSQKNNLFSCSLVFNVLRRPSGTILIASEVNY